MTNVIILGGGLVGGPMAMDLARDNDIKVSVCDINTRTLEKFRNKANITTVCADISQPGTLTDIVRDFDYVISAVPGYMGFATLEALINEGKNVIDIAFSPESPFDLDDLAKKKGVTAITDIGVAPGMSNILIGFADSKFDRISRVMIYVGGLPKIRKWPFEYKAGFSPIDVIEEYTRPARFIENGREITKPALTDNEFIDFEGIGTLEAFNSDGLRTLAKTIKADYMVEKTLRYPGHLKIMKILSHVGFFSKDEIEINGSRIAPLEITSRLLFPLWKLEEDEEDITVMKVIVEGQLNKENMRYCWDLYDSYDLGSGVHSMARTTGYTATMALRMLISGLYDFKGVTVPEYIGRHPDCVEFILEGLRNRNVIYDQKIEKI